MKLLYLECNMGAAGDMLMGALADLLPDKQSFADRMNRLGIPGVHVELQNAVKCGIVGTHAEVSVNGTEEESLEVPTDAHAGENIPVHEVHSHSHGHHGEPVTWRSRIITQTPGIWRILCRRNIRSLRHRILRFRNMHRVCIMSIPIPMPITA